MHFGELLHKLAIQKESRIEEREFDAGSCAHDDFVPPKYAVSQVGSAGGSLLEEPKNASARAPGSYRAEAERVVEFPAREQSCVGGNHRTAKLDHQPAVKIDPEAIWLMNISDFVAATVAARFLEFGDNEFYVFTVQASAPTSVK